MAEDTKNELVPVADYEVLDQVDDQAIVEMMTGQAIQDYVYSFKQGGKTVEGLTLAGINEAANRRGGIQVDDVNYEERDQSWLVIAKATDTVTGSSRYGAYEQAKRMGNREDPHAFTKAIHKAQRNAVKQLLPVTVIKEVLNFYLHRQAGAETAQMGLPSAAATSKVSNAQKAAFAMASKLEGKFEEQGITKSDFWSYVKRRYAVESRNDMTEMQWTQLSAELQAGASAPGLFKELVGRIQQLDAAAKTSEVPESPDPPLTLNEKGADSEYAESEILSEDLEVGENTPF